MFTPITRNLDERKEIFSLDKETIKNSLDELDINALDDLYFFGTKASNHAIELMKIYIIENWENIPQDYLCLDTYYHKGNNYSNEKLSGFFKKFFQHKPITKVEFVLDEMDGDLSFQLWNEDVDLGWKFMNKEEIISSYTHIKNFK
jgi:hypothetical protein